MNAFLGDVNEILAAEDIDDDEVVSSEGPGPSERSGNTCGSFSSSSSGALTDEVSMDRTLAVSQVAAVGLGIPDL
jgi:hypothetical protein